MNFLDPEFIKAIAQGGAPYALIALVIWVIVQGNKREEILRSELADQKKLDAAQSVKREETMQEQSAKREQIMRDSFAAREEKFLDVIQLTSERTAAAITDSALKMTQALAGTTQALTKLEENIEKNLDQMRRVIDK